MLVRLLSVDNRQPAPATHALVVTTHYNFLGSPTARTLQSLAASVRALKLLVPLLQDSSPIDGGGQNSGGQYKLTGTIGQSDAAYSSGGNYELLGGFWPGGSLCIVQFDDFASFAELWLHTGTGLLGDIDKDNDVDMEDLRQFADYWPASCPYNW
jgi:hypothetical protein